MKGKFKLLGHIGLVLFLVSALLLALVPAVPVAAATAVTNVWVEFPYTSSMNATSSASNQYYIHFKPATALIGGTDTVTVTFPDGSTATGGYAFTVGTVSSASEVSFSTDYGTSAVRDAVWVECKATPTSGGYRVKATTPIDVAAGQDVWVKVASDDITAASTAGESYKVYVQTNKDTTPVLSSAFALGSSVCTALTTTISPATAGAAAQYDFAFTTAATTGALTSGTSMVTVKFPVGTVLPSSISANNVQFSNNNSTFVSAGTTPTVDANKREVTATVSVTGIDAADAGYMRVLSGAGITNPTIASDDDYYCMLLTSSDRQWFKASAAHEVTGGTPTKLDFCYGEIGYSTKYYSDKYTMVYMYSNKIYVTATDDYGNAKAPSSNITVTLSSTSSTGAFYTCANTGGTGAMTQVSSITVSTLSPATTAQQIYYKDSTAGTHTLTASATSYTSDTWTIVVCPVVSLYDNSNNLVNAYGPKSTSVASETGSSSATETNTASADYINDAISAAMTYDTIKVGDGTYEVRDGTHYVALSKSITLESLNGAGSTTITTGDTNCQAVQISANNVTLGGTGKGFKLIGQSPAVIEIAVTATEGITIRGNTIRARAAGEGSGIYINDCTSMTIDGNTFYGDDHFTANTIGGVAVEGAPGTCIQVFDTDVASGATTSLTVSNNIAYNVKYTFFTMNESGENIDGVVVYGNTAHDCDQYGVDVIAGTVSSNGLKIYKNSFYNNGNGIYIRSGVSDIGNIEIKYNDIYSNTNGRKNKEKLGIYNNNSTAVNARYNWWGDTSGPSDRSTTTAVVEAYGSGDSISTYVTYEPWIHKQYANVVTDNASYQAVNMKLVAGWNTLSTPVKLISTADSIDELIPSGMTIGYYYDNGSWSQITTGYVLNPCDAVYVKMSAATWVLFKFDASAFSNPSKTLDAGWNLISLASLDASKTVANTMACVDLTAANLPGWSQVVSPSMNAAQTDIYEATETAWAESAGEAAGKTMQPGLGYWCYMQNAATLAGFEITPIVPDLD